MKKLSEEILFAGNWLLLKESTYLCSDKKEVKWESVERKQHKIILVIIAKLIHSNKYVLIRQYRPAINNYIIAFPAGVSESDNVAEEALREFKEETGYTGKIISISPVLKVNPGMIDDSVRIVNVEIDETNSINTNLKQSLEASEEIEVILKKDREIREFLQYRKEKGDEIGAGLWYVFGMK